MLPARGAICQREDFGGSENSESTYLLVPAVTGDSSAPSKWRKSICFILCSVVLERVAFYSLRGSIVYFLTKEPLCWTSADASVVANTLSAAAHFLSPVAGVIPDFFSSKVAVFLGYSFYVLGYSILTVHGFQTDGLNVTTKNEDVACTAGNYSLAFLCPAGQQYPCSVSIYTVCVVVALATSLLRTTMPPFGADQVRNEGLEVTRSFLAWYYWAVNAGALVSYSVVTYLQHKVGFGAGFMTPYVLVIISALLFAAGSHTYSWRYPNRAAMGNFFGILKVALTSCACRMKQRDAFTMNLGCFEYAKVINGGAYSSVAVDKVKAAGRTVAALFLMLPFWIIYSRVKLAFAQEGLRMSQEGVDSELQIAPMFNNIGLCVALPLCNLVIYPLVGRRGFRMTVYLRFITGMVICIICLVTAGFVELHRVDGLATGQRELIGNVYYNVSSVSIFWEIPQNFLLGAAEACTIVTAMELTYIAAPRSMQCVLMGLFWMFFGVGDVLNIVQPTLPYSVSPALQKDYNLKYFYFMVAAVLVGAVLIVTLIGRAVNLGLDALTIAAVRPMPSEPTSMQQPGRYRYHAIESSDGL